MVSAYLFIGPVSSSRCFHCIIICVNWTGISIVVGINCILIVIVIIEIIEFIEIYIFLHTLSIIIVNANSFTYAHYWPI